MTPKALQKAVAEWLSEATSLGASRVVVGVVTPDLAARLQKPYMVVSLSNDRELGEDAYVSTGLDTVEIQGLREARLALNVYGEDAIDVLAMARRRCSRPDLIRRAEALGFEAVEVGPGAPLMTMLDTGHEERARAEMLARYVETEEDANAGTIETVVADGVLEPGEIVSVSLGSLP